MLTLICAIAENRAIGFRNQLIYHLRKDLQRFKQLTMGHTIIMGRRTFESLPKGALPGRRNIVLSRSVQIAWQNTEVYSSLAEALSTCTEESKVFIIGGESLYIEALPLADQLHITHVHATPSEADVFFPAVECDKWECVFEERHEVDDLHPQAFTFADYVRIRNTESHNILS